MNIENDENDLLLTTDAQVWAEEFMRIFDGHIVRQSTWAEHEGVLDEGTMLGWFANAIETGRADGRTGLQMDGVDWAFLHFYDMDKANACIHCAPVRFSPVTFRLAQTLHAARPMMLLDSEPLAEVLDHLGKYEEDKGR